jgi:hypothetical protein
MRFTHFALFSLTTVAGLGLSPAALANDTDPASLLLYHEFDNRQGLLTLVTVTNANDDDTIEGGNGLQAGTIDVEFVYRGRVANCYNGDGHTDEMTNSGCLIECTEFNRTRRLTPNDTLSVITRVDNPEAVQGYLYVFAKRVNTNVPVKFDHLIGNSLVIDGLLVFEHAVNPIAYKAGEGLSEGDETDLDGDGLRDLNGDEYETTTDQLLVPRFFGQNIVFQSDLVLINLTGGVEFDATVFFLVYNDNEEVFSAEHRFRCWERIPLLHISQVFDNNFLLHATNDNPQEILGAPGIATGWIRMDGKIATSQSAAILDPAIEALLIERVRFHQSATLPWTLGEQDNGDLLADGPFGDAD